MANIVEYITADAQAADYANLVSAASFAGLVEDLKGDNLTLLAPRNDLLNATNIPMVYRWNADLTKALLLNHVASNIMMLADGTELEVLSEEKLSVTDSDGNQLIGNVPYEFKHENADKSFLIYDLEGVLIPTSQSETTALTTDLLSGAAGRLGTFFSGYTTGAFYDALKSLNTDASEALFDADLGYTVFLPDSDAWKNLTDEVENKVGTAEYCEDGGLTTALKAHITTGTATVTDTTYKSLDDTDIVVKIPDVTIAGGMAKIGNTVAVNFKNGQVHNLDKVLQFPRQTTVEIAVATADTKTLVELVTTYKLVDALNGLKRSTIFAPTNDALNPLVTYVTWNTLEMTETVVTNILKHHVLDSRVYAKDLPESGKVADGLDGTEIVLSDLDVVLANVLGTNGNIHVISKPLLPPNYVNLIPTVNTVVDIAKDTATTSKLYDFLGMFPDIVATLETITPGTSFTVFAPTNEAFDALSAADLAYLTANNNEKLLEVLKYHVVPAAALAGSLNATNTFPTVLDGSSLTVTKSGDTVSVNGAMVVGADVKAINGVAHVIDQVLVPGTVVLPSSVTPASASSLSVSALVMAVATVCVAAV